MMKKALINILLFKTLWHIKKKRPIYNNYISILCYHRVLPGCPGINIPWTVTPEEFQSHMAFLKNNEFRTISITEFNDLIRGRRLPTQKCVLVTLDDGYNDNYTIAWPIAQRNGIKLNLFIPTSFINERGPMIFGKRNSATFAHIKKYPDLWEPLTWSQLRDFLNSEINLGLHGHTHRNMASLEKKELTSEVILGSQLFKKELQYIPKALALPYGIPRSFTNQTLQILKDLGIEMVFSTLPGRLTIPCEQLLFPRFVIDQSDNLRILEMKLFGTYDWIGTVRHFIKY